MFDYQTSKHAHFDAACRAFALSHNLEDVAAAVGMRPQILRNKLNPVQPHRLTCDELLAIQPFKALRATLIKDRVHSRALARHSMAKKIFRRPKSHYTAPACGFWIIKIFQFYFSTNRAARPRQCWRPYGKPELKRLKRISVFFSFIDLTVY